MADRRTIWIKQLPAQRRTPKAISALADMSRSNWADVRMNSSASCWTRAEVR
jgi:hypothetical protein